MQDDLVNMMSRHLQLNPVQHQDSSMPPTPQVSPQPGPITYITQHYHHSAHQASTSDSQVSSILENAGINAAALLPTQLSLFSNAQPEQQQRLVELWRISPPTPGHQMMPNDMGNWPQTSMEKEEEAARHRWEKEREGLKNLTAFPAYDNRNHAEPYIMNGYSDSNINGVTARTEFNGMDQNGGEYRRCKDPVYNSREWWSMDDQPMEHQYGLLQHMMYGNMNAFEYSNNKPPEDDDEEML